MSRTTLEQDGRAAIPAEIQHRLGLSPGDEVLFVIDPGGRVMLERQQPRSNLAEVAGRLRADGGASAISVEDMNAAVGEFLAAEDARTIRGVSSE